MTTKPELHRALLALDARGDARILATDSACIAGDCDALGTTCADDVGLCSSRKIDAGLWLWEGTVSIRPVGPYGEDEPVYDGALKSVISWLEAARLFAMRPPEPEFPDEDREQAGV